MLSRRIIPCLDVRDGRTVKGVHFENLRDAGDAVELAAFYAAQGADELVFLDISATIEQRKTLKTLVERVASEIFIPFTVGGGIRSVEDCAALLRAGADKISLNSAAVRDPPDRALPPRQRIRDRAGIFASRRSPLRFPFARRSFARRRAPGRHQGG